MYRAARHSLLQFGGFTMHAIAAAPVSVAGEEALTYRGGGGHQRERER